MTKEEAIKILSNHEMIDVMWDKADDALNMAIDALEQEPCEDCISREAVLKVIDGWYDNNRDTENIEDLIVLITYMSSIQPKAKKEGSK